MSMRKKQFFGFTCSVATMAIVLWYSFSPDVQYGRSLLTPLFTTYLASLAVGVFYWKRLQGWADGYISGFALGAVVWIMTFIIKALTF